MNSKQLLSNLECMIGRRIAAKATESRFGTWSAADERDLNTLQAAYKALKPILTERTDK